MNNPQTIWIEGPLPGLNEIIAAAKCARGMSYARLKKDWTARLVLDFRQAGIKPRKTVFLKFIWCERTMRRDPDNVAAGGRKLLLDSMIKAGIIKDDGWKQIRGWEDTFEHSHKDGVWLTIE